MLRRCLAALLAACVALSVPGIALADNAGDNQYVDPFANGVPQSGSPKKQTSSATTQAPTAAPAPTLSQPNAPAPVVAAPPTDTLPRTGFPLLPVAAIGAALVAAGLALRRLT